MKVKARLIIDLGNSETRVVVKKAKDSNSGKIRKRFNLSNRFYLAEPKMVIPENYTPNDTTVFTVVGENAGTYINGRMVLNEYEKVCRKPTAQTSKASDISSLSICLAIIKATRILAKELEINPRDLEVSWHIVTLLPPKQCSIEQINAMKSMMGSVDKVVDLFTLDGEKLEININIDSKKIFPEGFAGYVGCIYNEDGEIRDGYEKYESDTTLGIDIGAGTTDVLVVSNSEVIDNTKETFVVGGNTVRAKLKKVLRDKYNYGKILDSQVEGSMVTGKIKDGSTSIDITSDINSVKNEVARGLVDDIQDYMEGVDFSMRNIGNLLTFGGGTLGGEAEDNKPISDDVLEFLKQFAPRIQSIPLPEITVKEGETYFDSIKGEEVLATENMKVKLSPRELNIIGAEILSDLEQA